MRQNTTASHIYFFYRSYIIQQYSPNDNSYCQFAYFSLLRGIMQTLAAWWGAGKGGGAGERSFCIQRPTCPFWPGKDPAGRGGQRGSRFFQNKGNFKPIQSHWDEKHSPLSPHSALTIAMLKSTAPNLRTRDGNLLILEPPPPIQPPHSFFVLHCRIVTLSCIRGLECWL